MCHSFGCLDDNQLRGSFVLKLWQLWHLGKIQQYAKFLQNIQDSRSNFLHVKPHHDGIQACTKKFQLPDDKTNDKDAEDNDCNGNKVEGNDLDAFLDALDASVKLDGWNMPGHKQFDQEFAPQKFNCHGIVMKCAHKCERQNLCSIPETQLTDVAANEGSIHTTNASAHNSSQTMQLRQMWQLSDQEQDTPAMTCSKFFWISHSLSKNHQPWRRSKIRDVSRYQWLCSIHCEVGKNLQTGQTTTTIFWGFCKFFHFVILQWGQSISWWHFGSSILKQIIQWLRKKLLKLSGRRMPDSILNFSSMDDRNLVAFLHGLRGTGKFAVVIFWLIMHDNFVTLWVRHSMNSQLSSQQWAELLRHWLLEIQHTVRFCWTNKPRVHTQS